MKKEVEVTHDGRQYHVTVEGVDVTDAIAAGGLSIDWNTDGEHPVVKIRLLPTLVRVKLPEATVQIIDELSRDAEGQQPTT